MQHDVPKAIAADASGDVVITGTFPGAIDFGGGAMTAAGYADIFVAKLNDSGDHVWSERFGLVNHTQQVEHIALDGQGRVLLTGSFSESGDFGSGLLAGKGGNDIFVAVLDASGAPVWSKSFGDGSYQEGGRVGADAAGNVYISGDLFGSCADFGDGLLCGAGKGDIFVAKFDPAGQPLWSMAFGDNGEQLVGDMAIDAAGNVYLTGYMTGTVDFGGGALGPVIEETTSYTCFDIFVAKLGPDGEHIFSARYGDTSVDIGAAIAVDASKDVFITGRYDKDLSFGDGPLPTPNPQTGAMFLTRLPVP
jgi:hypothetical protein